MDEALKNEIMQLINDTTDKRFSDNELAMGRVTERIETAEATITGLDTRIGTEIKTVNETITAQISDVQSKAFSMFTRVNGKEPKTETEPDEMPTVEELLKGEL